MSISIPNESCSKDIAGRTPFPEFTTRMEGRHRRHSMASWWTAVIIVGMAAIHGGGQLARAHQFSIQNQLNDSVAVDCHSDSRSNGQQQLMSGKRYVFTWSEKSAVPEDWICGFSWLGTTYVKQFSVWNHTLGWGPMSCEICDWKVDPSGFFLKGNAPDLPHDLFMFEWDASCLSSLLYATNRVSV